jgi:thiamine-phosphate pyrophosphorylase
MRNFPLYLVLDLDQTGGISQAIEVSRQAIEAGVSAIQIRSAPHWKKRDLIHLAQQVLMLTQPARIPCIINDHIDVALLVNADGVHLGQKDIPVSMARTLLGPDKIIGLSVSHQEELTADLTGVDYLGIGPIYPTRSKPDAAAPVGVTQLHQWLADVHLPTVAIGGITLANAAEVLAQGVGGIAVVSAICMASDPESATRALVALTHASLNNLKTESTELGELDR